MMEYLETEARRQAREGLRGPHAYWSTCRDCKKPFTFEGKTRSVYTMAGARETQISGMCETCFDGLFRDDEVDSAGRTYEQFKDDNVGKDATD